jgi:lipopolysaccharide export system permease protein
MKLLDSYIARRYVGSLIKAVLAAVVVFLVVDNVDNLDTFIDNHVPAHQVIRYYYLFIPQIIYLTLPVATLLATLFTIGGLTQTNEMTAMHASGIPFRRPLLLLLSIATVSALIILYLGETVIPVTNRERMDIERYEVKKIPRETRANLGRLYFQLGDGRQLFVGRYNADTGEAYDIQMMTADSGHVASRVDADKMVWRDEKWFLQGAREKQFGSRGIFSINPHPNRELDFKGLQPEGFAKIQTAPEEMNYRELSDFIERMRISGGEPRKWIVDLLFKISMPVAAVVIVLFGAPIAAVKRRGGTAVAFGLALFICFIYFGFMQVGKIAGYSGLLTPMASAWIGNAFFGTLGLVITVRSRK